jgi:hypothetical protein
MCLFACFGLIGVVHGNIVQSTRGLISIGIGYLLARAGHAHIEERVSRATMLRRVVAGVLMLLAVALFTLGARAAVSASMPPTMESKPSAPNPNP